jgi:hypothetical protein
MKKAHWFGYRDLTSPEKPASANIPRASPAIRWTYSKSLAARRGRRWRLEAVLLERSLIEGRTAFCPHPGLFGLGI